MRQKHSRRVRKRQKNQKVIAQIQWQLLLLSLLSLWWPCVQLSIIKRRKRDGNAGRHGNEIRAAQIVSWKEEIL